MRYSTNKLWNNKCSRQITLFFVFRREPYFRMLYTWISQRIPGNEPMHEQRRVPRQREQEFNMQPLRERPWILDINPRPMDSANLRVYKDLYRNVPAIKIVGPSPQHTAREPIELLPIDRNLLNIPRPRRATERRMMSFHSLREQAGL